MAHDWKSFTSVVSFSCGLLHLRPPRARLRAHLRRVPTLESAITLIDLNMLQSLRVDGLTLRVSAGPAVSNAAMAFAINPQVFGIQN